MSQENKLQSYLEPGHPGSFGGRLKLQQETGASRKQVETFLQGTNAYNLFAPARKRFPRRKIIARYKNHIFESDLMSTNQYPGQNRGMAFICVCVDVLSKRLFLRKLRRKTPIEIKTALQSVFRIAKPEKLHTGIPFVQSRKVCCQQTFR